MAGQVKSIPVPVILAAVSGDENALDAVVAHYVHLPGPQIHPRPQADSPDAERAHREDRSVQRREDRRCVGTAAPYSL